MHNFTKTNPELDSKALIPYKSKKQTNIKQSAKPQPAKKQVQARGRKPQKNSPLTRQERPGERLSRNPPDLQTSPSFFYKRRYASNANILGNLMISSLISSLMVATTAVLTNSILRAIRLKKITIWAPVVTNGTPVTIVITPITVDPGNNSFTDFPETYTDTSDIQDTPACVTYRPKPNEPLGSWHATTAVDANLMSVLAPTGSIMDLEFEGIMNTTFTTTAFSQVIAGATPGTVYARTVITNFVPVAVNNL